MNAEDVKEVERKIEELESLVVTASNTSRICAVDEKVNLLQEGRENSNNGRHHVRPPVSAFFSGRKKELKTLKDMLEKQGSAVVTQYGGVGKTELMVAFADQAEQDQHEPGGVFWLTVDGNLRDVIGSLARLAEKLTRRKMSEEERRNANLVIAELKQGLDERQGRWLLCLDNADDSRVSGILNEVCGIAVPSRGNGWIVVTSRQGQPHIWDRMKSEQKLTLEPLCAEDAMVALWRQIRKIEWNDADDCKVMSEINELKSVHQAEYCVLKKLRGDDDGHGLGGLPLAIVQAGSFIAQFNYSFADYLNLFESASEDWEDVMNKTEELKSIRKSQRSIWTTWKISVQKLSGTACTALRAMAILGQGCIGEAIVNGILKAVAADGGSSVQGMFRNVIVKELMHGSSLIWCDEKVGNERAMYRMHGLVRRFILGGMVRGSAVWNQVYSLALPAVHDCVRIEIEEEGNSFSELPDVFENNHCEFATHCLALVQHHTLQRQVSEMQHVSEVEDIHWYSSRMMEFMGKWDEEIEVREHLLAILQQQLDTNRKRGFVERFKDMWYHRNQAKEVKGRIARVYRGLGAAVMETGNLNRAASELEQSLAMERATHGRKRPHHNIAGSLNNLGNVYKSMGELEKALEKHEESLEMRRVIHGHEKPHPDIATSLNNLGNVYEGMGELKKALEKHEQSLAMRRAIHGHEKPHPDIAGSLNNLGNLYKRMGELEKALEKHEESLEMRRVIHGHEKPHPDIATSLNNLGNVYEGMGELKKALEKHDESLAMRRTIHGLEKPQPDTAVSLWNIGSVYHLQKNRNEAAKFLEQSLDMLRILHVRNSLHPHIMGVLFTLAEVYDKQ